ncbi:MAG: hypothetical protein H0U30_02050 [Actinobacteria bacterium]|nr:hypothetical protein [Actinomycetota bacterium]
MTFRDESLPLPLRVHFLYLKDSETGEEELKLVGVELGDVPRDDEAAIALPELTALTLRQVVERFPRWLELARAHATPSLDAQASTVGLAVAVKRWKPARLDPNFLRMVAAEYRRHVDEGDPAPITTIAKSHGVTPSAASRWLKRARKEGYLDAS